MEPETDRAAPTPLLAHAATRLIGRQREVELARGLLAEQDVRLLTITGPGGVAPVAAERGLLR